MKRGIAWLAVSALAALATGCGAVLVEPQTVLPRALVEQAPVTVGVHYPQEFRGYVYKETRYGTDYEVKLGPAHVAELNRLLGALFAKVVELDDPQQAPRMEPPVRLVLVPRFEDYSFLTPRDMAGDTFTVTIRYRLDVYTPGGERVDGYVFTGYGRTTSGALKGTAPLLAATQRAMREAGAKLAVELPDEDTVRALLAGEAVVARPEAWPGSSDAIGVLDDAVPATPPESVSPQAMPPDEEAPIAAPAMPPPP